MTRTELVIRYGAFAAAATLANLAAQRIVLALVEGYGGYVLAVAAGTGAGLVLKYLLDRRWIFYDTSTGLAVHGRDFTLYTVMGVVTTLIFWVTESAFWLVWRTDLMREVGAVLGLTAGYAIKYNLDKRFVFRNAWTARG